MDCTLSSTLSAGHALTFCKSLSYGIRLNNVRLAAPTARSPRLGLYVRNTLQEEEGRRHAPVFSTSTIFKVAGVAATMAAVIFALPISVSTKKEKDHERAAEKEDYRDARMGKKKEGLIRKKDVMPTDERIRWTQNLPMVQEKIAYTSILELHGQGKLKHIIKHPHPALRSKPQMIFVVLDDDRVVRSVLPAFSRDEQFWNSWKTSKLESLVVNAYTPPAPKPESPWKGVNVPFWNQRKTIPLKKEPPKQQKKKAEVTQKLQTRPKAKKSATTARLDQLERARRELEQARAIQEVQLKMKKLRQEEAEKEAKKRALKAKRLEEEQKKLAQARQAESEKLIQGQQATNAWDAFWEKASRSEGFRFMLGLIFFWLFYKVIILGVKQRRKDYEDRLKIERAEEEERRKMEEWEAEADAAEAVLSVKDWSVEKLTEEEKKRNDELEQNPQVQMGLKFMRSGARVRRAKGKRPPKYLDIDADVRFEDVAGLGEIRRELEEIVDFFKYKEKYLRRGSKIPSGILLCGEPGTGKTLLAKAVAGEAGVNFFSISASQFVEIYVGVGASRVRALYQEAKENAPAVVFIDELDAVGRQRGLIGGSGGQERDATLNQLLTCLDGFEGRGDVITVAATNRVDILDSALVRPGRFDRKIFIPKPSIRGRIEILKVHARNKPMADDVDYDAIGNATDGMVGAQLANLLDVAALNVLRDGRTEITTDDLLDAASLEEGGHVDLRPRSRELWHKMALNEAALAVAAVNFPDFKDVELVSLIPRSGEDKGSVRSRIDSMKFETSTMSRQGMMDYITIQLAPRAADELLFGRDQMCTVWTDHYNNARKVARYYVFCGLSERSEVYGMFHCWSELARYYEVDKEARRILEACYNRAQKIIANNQVFLKELTDQLIDMKAIKKDEFQILAEKYAHIERYPPSVVDIRREKLEEFREQIVREKRTALY
ncbi:hypothetical protein KP509_06G030400 [Ceratopteris richardii]|uniref:AAA+ ATPase domain-containing protein n=1 Tax=Ceratopteris richardii TaxID=49495 RepID=A0A8T2UME3_CERRI|nr:hypothetical protein KP509_06G030400 [Ceratopteris richardii]